MWIGRWPKNETRDKKYQIWLAGILIRDCEIYAYDSFLQKRWMLMPIGRFVLDIHFMTKWSSIPYMIWKLNVDKRIRDMIGE